MRNKVTAEERAVMAKMGRKGGKAKHPAKGFGSWTAAQRSAAGRKSAETRKKNLRKAAKAAGKKGG